MKPAVRIALTTPRGPGRPVATLSQGRGQREVFDHSLVHDVGFASTEKP